MSRRQSLDYPLADDGPGDDGVHESRLEADRDTDAKLPTAFPEYPLFATALNNAGYSD